VKLKHIVIKETCRKKIKLLVVLTFHGPLGRNKIFEPLLVENLSLLERTRLSEINNKILMNLINVPSNKTKVET
jgi:hypothetical protein